MLIAMLCHLIYLNNKTTSASTMSKSMLWLLQLRFDTEEDMSFCRCMKCGEEGQDVAEIGSETIGVLHFKKVVIENGMDLILMTNHL